MTMRQVFVIALTLSVVSVAYGTDPIDIRIPSRVSLDRDQETVDVLPRGIFCIDGDPQQPLKKDTVIEILEQVTVRCALIIKHNFVHVRVVSEGDHPRPSYYIKNFSADDFTEIEEKEQ